jgi:hypothetical protein
MLVEDMSRNKCLFQVRISHVLRFISTCDVFTDSLINGTDIERTRGPEGSGRSMKLKKNSWAYYPEDIYNRYIRNICNDVSTYTASHLRR